MDTTEQHAHTHTLSLCLSVSLSLSLYVLAAQSGLTLCNPRDCSPPGPFEHKFQKIARRDKKAFLSDQCKELEENNRMRKTRDLFKKIRDTKGTFHAKMGAIKDRNGMDLTEAEYIKRRWQEY